MLNLDLDFQTLKLANGQTIPQLLKGEADRFLDILQEEINRWYGTYLPAVYQRTYMLPASLLAEDVVTVSPDAQHFSIRINYQESHGSLWGSTGNVLKLMNEGYQVGSDKWFSNIPYLGYRPGGHFLEAALAKYNATKSLGVTVTASI